MSKFFQNTIALVFSQRQASIEIEDDFAFNLKPIITLN